MKKLLIFLLLLVIASSLWAEYGKFGVGAVVEIDLDKNVSPTDVVTKDNYFKIQPVFSMMLSESMELMPYAFYSTTVDKVDGTVFGKESSVGGGAGLYWHFVRTQHFRLMTGATVEAAYDFLSVPAADKDNSIIIRAYLPVIAEITMNDMISFRASLNIFTLTTEFQTSDIAGIEESDTLIYFDTVEDFADLWIGLMFRFG